MLTKPALRAQLSARRRAMTPASRERQRGAIRARLLDALPKLGLPDGATIAGYDPLPSEPGSVELLAELKDRGYRVLVPLTLADRDLDWVEWGRSGAPLGLPAIAEAAMVLVPALAVDAGGHRLGRGGGSYDRALARVPAGTAVVALLFTDEVLAEVPTDPWDLPVTAALTPEALIDLTPSGRRNRP